MLQSQNLVIKDLFLTLLLRNRVKQHNLSKNIFSFLMGQQGGGQAIRHQDDIDIYITQPDKKLMHYFANPRTQWTYGKQELGSDVVTKPTVIRFGGSIDVYYVNDKKQLIHYCVGDWNEWNNHWEWLDRDVASKQPACIRFENYIDVYYWKENGDLIHRYVSQDTQWKYSEPHVVAQGGGNNLFAMRNTAFAFDVYYELNAKLHHIASGQWSGWNHVGPNTYPNTPAVKSGSPIRATREGDDIDVFYLGQDNRICQITCNPRTKMQHQFLRYLQGPGPDNNEFTVVRMGNHIDLYYIRNNQAYHTYSGNDNNWAWSYPRPISDTDAVYGLCAVRTKQTAIDVFYMNKNDIIRNLCVGEGNNFDWNQYKYGSNQIFEVGKYTSHRKIMDLDQLLEKYTCKFVGEGWNGITYSTNIDGVQYIIKKYKRPNVKIIQNQMNVLDRLNSIHPGILFCELTSKGNLIGFIMLKFDGVTVDSLLHSKKLSANQKFDLIISFAQAVRRIQKLGICHSDLHIQNLLVTETGDMNIIDYGNAIIFDKGTLTSSDLTGTNFMRPPEYFQRPYCPIGVNAFQFARIAINIWSGKTFQQFWHLKDSSNQIIKINKDKIVAIFFKPIIQLLNIKNPFQRIVDSKLIQKLKQSSIQSLKVYEPQIPVYRVVTMSAGQSKNAIKAERFLQIIPNLAYLAHYLGFAWCGRYYVGEDFYLSQSSGASYTFTTKPEDKKKTKKTKIAPRGILYEVEQQEDYGFRNNDRLKIKISQISKKTLNPQFGDTKIVEKVIVDKYRAVLDNSKGKSKKKIQTLIQREVEKKVQVAKQSTTSTNTGIQVSGEFQTPFKFLGGIKITVGLSQQIGYSVSNTSTNSQSKKTTFSRKIQEEVKPGKKVICDATVIGLKCQMEMTFVAEQIFSVTFVGFMRKQDDGGSFHRDGKKGETVTYKLGSQGQCFWEQLKNESQNESVSVWRWNDMLKHHANASQLIQVLCNKQAYQKKADLTVAGIEGTQLLIKTYDQ